MNLWEQCRPELIADLYEFTMAASYWAERMKGEATFSLFVRKYPVNRAYFVAAGLEHLMEVIENFTFSRESLDYLATIGKFPQEFLNFLASFRFSGTVRALPEGTVFFTDEPIVEVTGPIIEAQLLETVVINLVHLETLLATKAARCMQAAQGRGLVDFGLRRAQGVEAGLKAARTSYFTGFLGTSNLLAGHMYGIPVYGTMAHSYVTSFPREVDSFEAYARAFPDGTVLLIDTYDTLTGARKAVEVAQRLRAHGYELRAVRLDSGDLAVLSRAVRELFRREGFPEVRIMVSGSLDEYRLEELLTQGAEFDLVGIGTHLVVSADAPYLDMAYKLVEYEGRPILKLSPGKKTWVGRKQVQRFYDPQGKMSHDVLGLETESMPGARPLLEVFMARGRRRRPVEGLDQIRNRFREQWETLPDPYRAIRPQEHYPLEVSPALEQLEQDVIHRREREEMGRDG
jgi:nicotinate phosphoribosyltransferase